MDSLRRFLGGAWFSLAWALFRISALAPTPPGGGVLVASAPPNEYELSPLEPNFLLVVGSFFVNVCNAASH